MKRKSLLLALSALALSSCGGSSTPPASNASSSTTVEPSIAVSSDLAPQSDAYSEEVKDPIKLTRPRGIYFRDGVLHWDEVPNADYYGIGLEGGRVYEITSPQFAVKSFQVDFRKGEHYEYTLQAFSDSPTEFSASDIVSGEFVMPDTDEDINALFSQSRGYASLDGYTTTTPAGEDVTAEVEQGLYRSQIRSQGIDLDQGLQGYRAKYSRVEAKLSYDSISDWTANNYYPGEVVKILVDPNENGESFVDPIGLELDSITLSVPGVEESVTVQDPTISSTNPVLNDFKQKVSIKAGGLISSVNVSRVENTYSNNYNLGLPQQAKFGQIKIDENKIYISVCARQIYYTVYVDPITNPYGAVKQSDETILRYLNSGIVPAYVSSVSYGRIVSALITIEDKAQSYQSDYEFTGEDTLADLRDYLTRIDETSESHSISYDYFVYGGTSSTEGIVGTNLESILQALDESITPTSAMPISYGVSYLDGSASLAKLGSSAVYYVKSYEPIEPTSIVFENKEELENIAIGEEIDIRGKIYPENATLFDAEYFFLDSTGNKVTDINGLHIRKNESSSSPYSLRVDEDPTMVDRSYRLYARAGGQETYITITISNLFRVYYHNTMNSNEILTIGNEEFERVKAGNRLTKYSKLVYDGMPIAGVYRDPECESPFNLSSPILQDMHLYVQFSGFGNLRYYYVIHGRVEFAASYGITEGKAVENIFSFEGSEFATRFEVAGFYADAECTKPFQFGEKPTEDNTDVYIKLTQNRFQVSFDSNGGSAVSSLESVPLNATAQEPEEPMRNGYAFLGWYDDEELTEAFDFATPIHSDMILYAKWAEMKTIHYVLNGGTNAETNPSIYFEGYADIGLAEPTRALYQFEGWYKDSSFSEESRVESITKEDRGDITLYAKWSVASERGRFVEFFDGGLLRFDFRHFRDTQVADEEVLKTYEGYKSGVLSIMPYYEGERVQSVEFFGFTTNSSGEFVGILRDISINFASGDWVSNLNIAFNNMRFSAKKGSVALDMSTLPGTAQITLLGENIVTSEADHTHVWKMKSAAMKGVGEEASLQINSYPSSRIKQFGMECTNVEFANLTLAITGSSGGAGLYAASVTLDHCSATFVGGDGLDASGYGNKGIDGGDGIYTYSKLVLVNESNLESTGGNGGQGAPGTSYNQNAGSTSPKTGGAGGDGGKGGTGVYSFALTIAESTIKALSGAGGDGGQGGAGEGSDASGHNRGGKGGRGGFGGNTGYGLNCTEFSSGGTSSIEAIGAIAGNGGKGGAGGHGADANKRDSGGHGGDGGKGGSAYLPLNVAGSLEIASSLSISISSSFAGSGGTGGKGGNCWWDGGWGSGHQTWPGHGGNGGDGGDVFALTIFGINPIDKLRMRAGNGGDGANSGTTHNTGIYNNAFDTKGGDGGKGGSIYLDGTLCREGGPKTEGQSRRIDKGEVARFGPGGDGAVSDGEDRYQFSIGVSQTQEHVAFSIFLRSLEDIRKRAK